MTLRSKVALALCTLAIGCGGFDPCAGKAGVCIAVHVEGNTPGLDQLSVSVDVPATMPKLTPAAPRALELPLDFALVLPADTMGTVNISVDGLKAGVATWHDAKPATIVAKRGKATITLGEGQPDGAIDNDLNPPDLIDVCAPIVACMDGDGCCPSGCDNTSDHDCTPVCGNGAIETGEVCDDHNHDNGDACDPTCQYRNAVTTVSGVAGGHSFADISPRFSQPFSIAYDGTKYLYVTDLETYVVRRIDAVQGTTTTIGKPYNPAQVDGAFGVARFGQNLGAIAYVNGYVYIIDTYPTPHIREIDPAGQMVTSPVPLTGGSYSGVSGSGTTLVIMDNGDLKSWTRGAGSTVTLATAAQMTAAVGAVSCSSAILIGATYYIGCFNKILKVTNPGATPTVALYAGGGGAVTCDAATVTPLTSATISIAGEMSVDLSSNLQFTDYNCQTIRQVNGTQLLLFAGAKLMAGYINGFFGTNYAMARFNMPRAMVATNIGGTTYYVVDSGNDAIRALGTLETNSIAGAPFNVLETFDVKAKASYGVAVTGLATDGTLLYAVDGNGKLFSVDIASGDSALLHDFAVGAYALQRMGTTLYVALANGTIHSVGQDGMGDAVYVGTAGTTNPPTEGIGIGAILDAKALTTDGTDLYFFDGAKIVRKIDHATKQTSLVTGIAGTDTVVDGAPAVAKFGEADGDLVYANGALYRMDADTTVQGADTGLQLRKIDLATRSVTTIAGHSLAAGAADGIGLAAEFAGAHNLATDGTALFVFDAGNQSSNTDRVNVLSSTIREVELGSVSVTTMIGTRGQWTTNDDTGTKALVSRGGPMAFDSVTHAVYFFDNGEGVFRRIK